MDRWRIILLVVGPAPIMAASFGVSRWARSEPQAPPSGNHAVTVSAAKQNATPRVAADKSLQAECRQRAESLRGKLGADCAIIQRPPFVLAGDMSEQQLVEWHERTVGPAARAMAHAYFKTPPDHAVVVLLFSHEQSYNHYADALYGDSGISVYGYYKPQVRTLVMNIGTGGGTLVHEMTHALMDFDFPAVPDWFNEGLASMHEACHIRADETGLDGLTNWRLPGLQKAINQGRLPSLEQLIAGDDFRGPQMGLNYAQARYFCLYMQERGVLGEFFRQFRANHATDKSGVKTVRAVFTDQSWSELDEAFQAWVLTLRHER